MNYLTPAQEVLITEFYETMISFFNTIKTIEYIQAICFTIIFSGIYLWMFISLLVTLNEEIWLTNGIINMIPIFILEKNSVVREQVGKRKGMRIS